MPPSRSKPGRARKTGRVAAAPTPLQDQCLSNSDLVDQILRFLCSNAGDSENLSKAELAKARKALRAVALTSRIFSYSAVKILWRRLDNFFPLLCLLPEFRPDDRQTYHMTGFIEDADWERFDRHAAYVREVVYTPPPPNTKINPTTFIRLAQHKPCLLPNLTLFECADSSCNLDLILFVSPALASVRLETSHAADAETFLNLALAMSSPISKLTIAGLPSSILSTCARFLNLETIEFKQLRQPFTTNAFEALGSLPRLRSLTTDLSSWDPKALEAVAPKSVFCALTRMKFDCIGADIAQTIKLLLPLIGSPSMTSISVRLHSYGVARYTNEAMLSLSQTIASQWPTSLETLEIRGLKSTVEDFGHIEGATGIRTLELTDTLKGSLNDPRFLSTLRTWTHLESLTITGAEADLDVIKCLAQHCPSLHYLRLAFFPHPLPEVHTTPVLAHPLAELRMCETSRDTGWDSNRYHSMHSSPDLHAVAMHLDRLFPNLTKIHGEGYHNSWSQIEKLVFMCQQVRRTALQQQQW
ncbi:hypothetical protein R3P38DRAFT_2599710 [Favolaschia claudopus]|uniref:Uncharacterized protein n=1 Tax=Favolaschia claudopus TaxID=2862362 RepID=A0AAW0DZN3_9AGAR